MTKEELKQANQLAGNIEDAENMLKQLAIIKSSLSSITVQGGVYITFAYSNPFFKPVIDRLVADLEDNLLDTINICNAKLKVM